MLGSAPARGNHALETWAAQVPAVTRQRGLQHMSAHNSALAQGEERRARSGTAEVTDKRE